MDIRHTARARAKSLLKTTKCLAFALPFLGTQTAFAVSTNWIGGTSTAWATPTNWSAGVPSAVIDTANFTAVAPTFQPLNAAPISLAGINFIVGAPTTTLTNNSTITLDTLGTGIVNASGNTQNIINGTPGSILNLQGGTVGSNVAITNLGTLNILNSGSAAGAAILNSTALSIANIFGASTTIGSLEGNGTVALGAKILIVGSLNTNTAISGAISGVAGGLNKVGTGTLTLLASNSYGGPTIISAGTLEIGGGGAAGTLPASNVTDNGILAFNRYDAIPFAGVIIGSGSLEQRGTGTLSLSADNFYTGGTNITAGNLSIGNGTPIGSVKGDILISSQGGLIFNRTNNLTYDGVISGAGTLTKLGATSTVTLTGNSTYSGLTTLTAGTLQIGSGGLTGSVGLNTNFVAGATAGTVVFNRADAISMPQSATGVTVSNIGAGTLTILGGINAGALNVGAGSVIQLGNGGTAGNISSTTTISTTGTFRVDHGNNDLAIGNVISGTGGFIKAGTNNVTLTGANTYTGTTLIQSGTLTIGNGVSVGAGSLASLSILVNAGTTLALNRPDGFPVTSAISGAGNVVQQGAGAATLAADSTYTGLTTINAGCTLNLGGGAATGSVVSDIVNNGTLNFSRTAALTYAGVISGATGVVNKNLNNVLTLTGNNTYGGPTNIVLGTLQLGNGGMTGMIASDVIGSAGASNLRFNRADDITFAHSIQGINTLFQAGPGQLSLTGDVNASITTINGGVLQIGDGIATGGTLTGNLQVNSGTTAIFNRPDASTYTGVIQLSGTTIKRGAGDLTLTADSTNTGTFVLEQGTLFLGNGGAIGSLSPSSTLVNNGAVFINRTGIVTLPTTTGTGTVTVNGATLIVSSAGNTYTGLTTINNGVLNITGAMLGDIVSNSNNVLISATQSYDGAISGSSGLVKQGAVISTLNGANTYIGPTSVSVGTLLIGDAVHPTASITSDTTVATGATLGGFGTIHGVVTNNGIVAPGASIGTLTIVGNYNQSAGGTLNIELNGAGQSDLLVVQGAANVAGTLTLTAQGFLPGHQYTFLTATNGITGSFTNVNGLGQFAQNFLTGQLNVTQNAMSVSATLNANAIAAAANTSNRRALVAYLLATKGGTAGIQALIAQATTNGQLGAIFDSLTSSSIYANQDMQLAQTGSWFERELAQRMSTSCKSQRHFWVTPYGSSASIDSDGNSSGLDTGLGGLAFGVDMPIANGLKVGAAAAATYFSSDATDAVDATSSGTLFQVGVYGDYSIDNWTFGAGIDVGGTSDVDTTRNISDTSSVDGSYTSTLVSEQIKAAYDVMLVNNAHLHPFVGFVNQNVNHDSFTETGDADFAMNVQSGDYNSIKSQIGTALEVPMGGNMKFVSSVAWQHEFSDVNGSFDYTLANVTGSDSALVSGAEIGRESALVNAGLVLIQRDMMNVTAMYEGVFADGYTENGGKLQFNFMIG